MHELKLVKNEKHISTLLVGEQSKNDWNIAELSKHGNNFFYMLSANLREDGSIFMELTVFVVDQMNQEIKNKINTFGCVLSDSSSLMQFSIQDNDVVDVYQVTLF